MYFLKKHILNIIICMLVFGVLSTVVNIFIPPSNTTYEEYYTLETTLEPNSIANLNIALAESVNEASDKVELVSVDGQANSDILNLTITTETGLDYESIKAEAMDVLSEEGFTTGEELSSKTYITENTELKMMIILFGLFLGGIVGIIRAAADNNISTEEDIEHYLNERTLGTF